MPPEQMQKTETQQIVHKANDIWSFACTYRELLIKLFPYDNNNAATFNLVNRIAPTIPNDMHEKNKTLLQNCFNINLSERWKIEQVIKHLITFITDLEKGRQDQRAQINEQPADENQTNLIGVNAS